MLLKILLCSYLLRCIHYKFGEDKVNNENLEIYPYLHVKNTSKLKILFWDMYKEKNKQLFLQIKCKNEIIDIYRTQEELFLNSIYFKKNNSLFNSEIYPRIGEFFNLLEFNSKLLTYKINYETYNIKFNCDLEYWILIFKWKNWNNSYITNLQIYDSEEILEKTNFLNPLVFVDLRQENINTKFFKNKFDFYHGGINISSDKIDTNFNSFYDTNNGVNWNVQNVNQYIELDEKILYQFKEEIYFNFSFYINVDVFYKLLDLKNKKNVIYSLYSIKENNHYSFNLILHILINNQDFKLLFRELENSNTIFNKSTKRNEIIDKKELGIKFLVFSNYLKYNNLLIGFKKNSAFKIDNKLIFEKKFRKPRKTINFNNSKLKHFIGNNNKFNKPISNEVIELLIIINEYGVFSGIEFDKKEIIDDNIFLKIEGNSNILITNNINLDRKHNLHNFKEVTKCKTFKCAICNIDDICLYCKSNYFLDNSKNCIFNNESDKFINEFSEIVNVDEEINNNEFTTTNDVKSLNSLDILDKFNVQDSIIFLNINIQTFSKNIYSNFSLDSSKKYSFNFYIDNKINNSSFNIQLNNNLNIDLFKIQIENNLNYGVNIKKYDRKINCNNIENEIFYNDINCFDICSINGINYYYKPINYKQGYCVKNIEKGYFLDNSNNILKCKSNCSECNFNKNNNKYKCNKCINGYKLINNNCYFNNEFNCENNLNINDIFDNNNKDKIKICNDFCSICRRKNGKICSIINFGINTCDINNIIIKKSNNKLIKSNIEKCKNYYNNKCIVCKDNYFLNKNNICINCKENCNKCKDSLNCINCSKGFFLNNQNCLNCNLKFDNCLECNEKKCLKFKIKEEENKCLIKNCKKCNNNICNICNKNFNLQDNRCSCNLINNFFDKNKNCVNCNECEYCIKESKKICNNCSKCKDFKVLFNYIQHKNEIIISYDKSLIEIYQNPSFFKILNSKLFIILFENNKIIIRILENKWNNVLIIINKNIIKNLKKGYFNKQIIKLGNINLSYELNYIKLKNKINNKIKNNEFKNIKKYFFTNINFNNTIISKSIKYSNDIISYSRFLTIFLPFIININQSGLIILLNTQFSNNFVRLLKIIRKNNIPLIKNENIISSKEFNESYLKIKKKYKNNIIIGDINLLDIDLLIIFIILLIYYIIKIFDKIYLKNCLKNKRFINFLKKNFIYLKLIGLTIFQSYLIKNYYKIIFFIEVFFDLDNYLIKLFLFFWIQFYIILIILFFNYNHYFCQLFLNPILNFNFNDKIMIKLFVLFKNKSARNYNLIMNILDFFIVLIFMKSNDHFMMQIIMIKFIILIKITYLTNLFLKLKKNLILTQIISFILLFNFYLIIFLNHIFIRNQIISQIIIYLFLFINIWEIARLLLNNLIKVIKKKIKNKNSHLRNIYKNKSLKINKLRNYKVKNLSIKDIIN